MNRCIIWKRRKNLNLFRSLFMSTKMCYMFLLIHKPEILYSCLETSKVITFHIYRFSQLILRNWKAPRRKTFHTKVFKLHAYRKLNKWKRRLFFNLWSMGLGLGCFVRVIWDIEMVIWQMVFMLKMILKSFSIISTRRNRHQPKSNPPLEHLCFYEHWWLTSATWRGRIFKCKRKMLQGYANT